MAFVVLLGHLPRSLSKVAEDGKRKMTGVLRMIEVNKSVTEEEEDLGQVCSVP